MAAKIIQFRAKHVVQELPAQNDSSRLIRLLIRDIGRNLGIEFEPLPPEPEGCEQRRNGSPARSAVAMTAEITSLANRRSKVVLTVPTPEDTLEHQTKCLLWSIAVTLGIDGQGPFQHGPAWTRRERP